MSLRRPLCVLDFSASLSSATSILCSISTILVTLHIARSASCFFQLSSLQLHLSLVTSCAYAHLLTHNSAVYCSRRAWFTSISHFLYGPQSASSTCRFAHIMLRSLSRPCYTLISPTDIHIRLSVRSITSYSIHLRRNHIICTLSSHSLRALRLSSDASPLTQGLLALRASHLPYAIYRSHVNIAHCLDITFLLSSSNYVRLQVPLARACDFKTSSRNNLISLSSSCPLSLLLVLISAYTAWQVLVLIFTSFSTTFITNW